MRTYILFISTDKKDVWYGYYEDSTYRWSGWVPTAAQAVQASLGSCDNASSLEELKHIPSSAARILYESTNPLTLEVHPEFFI